MIKLVILLAVSIAAISCESDDDNFIGNLVPIAVSPKINEDIGSECLSIRIDVTRRKCTCKDKTDLLVVTGTSKLNTSTNLIVIVVKTEEDIASALEIKTSDCSCDSDKDKDTNLQMGVFKLYDANYLIRYARAEGAGKEADTVVVYRDKVPSRSDFEAVLEANGISNNYTLICNEFTD